MYFSWLLFHLSLFLPLCLLPALLSLSAHDGQKLCRAATQDAVRFHRFRVLLCVQGNEPLVYQSQGFYGVQRKLLSVCLCVAAVWMKKGSKGPTERLIIQSSLA